MMKNGWRSAAAAAAFVALLWPAAQVQAVCTTSLADSTNPDCKAAWKCQLGISTAAQKYVTAFQQTITKFINKSQTGGLTAAPLYRCIGGANDAVPCTQTNGACKKTTGSPAGKLCTTDADCNNVLNACDLSKGCNPLPAAPNAHECQVNQAKNPYAGAIAKAQTALSSAIVKACVSPVPVPASIVGITNIATCPGAGTAATDADAYNELVQCIEQSAGGDLTTGNVTDANELALQVSAGTGSLPPNNKFGKPPRMLLQLGGTQLLQIGTTPPSGNGESAGGNITPLNLAHCVGGNGNGSCVNDVPDCGTDTTGTPGVCTANAFVGPEIKITGTPAFSPGGLGPVLSLSATCATGTPTCLVTHTKDSGNGTTTDGLINLTTGHYTSKSPIVTDVFVTGSAVDCSTFKPCPVCDATSKSCIGTQADVTAKCDVADQSVTIECTPTGVTAIHVPNPFVLSTDPKSLTPASGFKFCGFCDNNAAGGCQGGAAMCANGCQTNTDCTSLGIGATVCDFGSTSNGFLGNAATSIITAPGSDNQYEPEVSGIFCTGITSNGTVNGAAGLPGPVRVVVPYTFGYVVGKN
jgi:hypothetical protein